MGGKTGRTITVTDSDPDMGPRLETENLVLRPLHVDDVSEAYVGWLNDPEINRFLESRFVLHSLASVQSFVQAMSKDRKNILFGIFEKASKRHVGNIKVGPIDLHHETAVVGLMIGERACWGRGYATEAISEVSRYGFMQLGLKKLVAGVYENNIGSLRAFQKAGYDIEGRQRNQFKYQGERVDGVLMGRTANAGDEGKDR
jgi:RimJ/RimL family protein N-acetyltransferase